MKDRIFGIAFVLTFLAMLANSQGVLSVDPVPAHRHPAIELTTNLPGAAERMADH